MEFLSGLGNGKYGCSETPRVHKSRKLWEEKSNESKGSHHEKWSRLADVRSEGDTWDSIEAPQFVDFSHVSDVSDSFFELRDDGQRAKRKDVFEAPRNVSNVCDDHALAKSLRDISISSANIETSVQVSQAQGKITAEDKGHCIGQGNTVATDEPMSVNRKTREGDVSRCTRIQPFSFDSRDKCTQERKNEFRINKASEKENQLKGFRATPLPRYIKLCHGAASSAVLRSNSASLNNPTDNENKPLSHAKAPVLRTALRAESRRRFEDALKEKRKQAEILEHMEMTARKRREDEEIARMRKATVHKAQPIRWYKSNLPRVEKRPLTDPITPKVCKRQRRF